MERPGLLAQGFLLAFMKGAKKTRLAFPLMFAVLFSANFESWLAGSLNPITILFWILLTLITSEEFVSKDEKDFTVVAGV